VIVKRPEIERALDRPTDSIRCFLLYGPDEAGSHALADRLANAMGAEAERIDLDGPALAKDPALLADEAASSSLFGGARHIRVRANGDEIADAVEALLANAQPGNPVAIMAGALKPSSRLVKLASSSPQILACVSYPPEGRDADQLVIGLGNALGLRISPEIARRLFDAAAGDRAVAAQELEKIAAFLDAGEGSPREVDAAILEAIGAGEGESDAGALVDAALTGQARRAVEELKQLGDAGEDGIPLVRAMLRRLLQLAAIRSEADRSGIAAAMNGAGKSLFWKDKSVVEAELRRWNSPDLALLIERMTAAQAALLSSGSTGAVAASQELLQVVRAAASRGR
jgi:DNA polymerase III subunit delta